MAERWGAADSVAEVGVLGSATLRVGSRTVSFGPRQGRLLAALVLRVRDGASPEWLVERVWGSEAPSTVHQSLHNLVSRLRQQLPPDCLQWDGERYRLDPTWIALDVVAFEHEVASAARAAAVRDAVTVLKRSEETLQRWRGQPYSDLAEDDVAAEAERVRLGDARADLQDLHARALLDLGQLPAAVAAFRQLVEDAPHREQRWVQLMTALARSGRRLEALESYQDARTFFVGELGLEVPEALTRLQRRILAEEFPVDLPAQPRDGPPVGRTALVAELDRLLDDEQVVVLTGEAGIGKSSVARALARERARKGRTVVEVTCLTNPWSALQPVVDLLGQLRPLLEMLQPRVGRFVEQLLRHGARAPAAALPSALPDPGALHDEVADAVGRLAERRRELTIVLDDAHLGGPTSHRVLQRTLERSPQVRLVAVARQAHYLPNDLTSGAAVVPVGPIDFDATHVLVARELGVGRVDELVRWLYELTDGNPLFVTALLNDLRRTDSLRTGPAGIVRPPTTFEVPARLHDVIEATIASLGLATRRALDVAAVLDEPAEEALLAEFVDPAPLEAAIEAGVLGRDAQHGLWFRHALLRRVAYDLVPSGRRAELHYALALRLHEQEASVARVAAHALAAAAIDPLKAAEAAEAAATAALETLAFEEAGEWFDRAAQLATANVAAGEREQLRLRIEAADARRLAGVPGHAEELLDLAEQTVSLGSDSLRSRAVLASLRLGGAAEAGPLQQRAAALARLVLEDEADRPTRAAVLAAASLVHSISGEPDRCRQLIVDALGLLDDNDPVTAVQVLPYAYMGLSHIDDLPQRAEAASRLRRDATALDDPVALFEGWHLTFSVGLQQGNGVLARSAHEQMRNLLDRVGDAGRRWSFAYQEAALAHLDDRLDDAEKWAEEALGIGSGVAETRAFGAYAGQLVELRRAAGRVDELAPLVDDLVVGQAVLPAWRAVASFVFAGVDASRSQQMFSEMAADGFAALPRDFTWLGALQMLTRGAVIRQDVDQAVLAAKTLGRYSSAVCWQGTCSYGPIAIVLAEVALLQGDDEEAVALAAVARERAASLDAPGYGAEAEAVLAKADGRPPRKRR